MTDAPNSVAKFGRRKPCLRYIGLSLGTTCVAPVGRGDLTPPPVCFHSPVGGGLRPAPPGKASFRANSRWFGTPSPPRRGGPMCPPGHAFAGPAQGPTHGSAPTKPPSPPTGRGRSPAPTGPGVLIPWGQTGTHDRPLIQKQRDVSRETSRCPADPPWMQGIGLYAGPGGEGGVIAPLPSAGRLLSRGGTGRSGPPRRRSADPSADPGPPGPPRGGSELPRHPRH